ncbi:MAG: 2-oxoglutarate dehydrogenase complex dihydrolipoyllysine-residue succinyltransferase [Desulfuromonadaceae bacterium]|nr:2-oxoglutarate dehydrogenase complex dihydrolipoyllysine-residue succinyltransferase [Desulfuromonadaceae bacterium]
MDVKIPAVGESILEGLIAKWHKKTGDTVQKDELICEFETDKVTVEIRADAAGTIALQAAEGETLPIGATIATIDASAAVQDTAPTVTRTAKSSGAAPINPGARQLAEERGIDPATLHGSGRDGRVIVADVLTASATVADQETTTVTPARESPPTEWHDAAERTTRKPMSPLRKKIAERLLQARQQTAMLTTFNEADMSHIIRLRREHQEHFMARHQVKLGFMSFFVKATVAALKEFPEVNAQIDGDDIVYHHAQHIGIAVGGKKGLVVPVLRDADQLSFAAIERQIAEFGEKVSTNKIALAELEGGTFTISNGGVYGSLLSTPILNVPQSGVLGMHAIQERPVARDGEIVICPMMYLALSYDHRLVDGRQAVGCLKRIKDLVEAPEELILEL